MPTHTIIVQGSARAINFSTEIYSKINFSRYSGTDVLRYKDYKKIVNIFLKNVISKDFFDDYGTYLRKVSKSNQGVKDWTNSTRDSSLVPKQISSRETPLKYSNLRGYVIKKEDGICRSYAESRQCEYGDNCKFRHIDFKLKRMPKDVAERIRGYCMSFLKNGFCRQGQRCKNEHVPLDDFDYIKLSNSREKALLEEIKLTKQKELSEKIHYN